MSINKTWNNTVFPIPNTRGESGWEHTLSSYLQALADNAATTTFNKQAVRKATTTPVTVSASTDCTIIVDLTGPGASTVNLPAGADKQIFIIVDGKGDASTNNITIDANGSETIEGSLTKVIRLNRECLVLQYSSSAGDWKVIGGYVPNMVGGPASATSGRVAVYNGTTGKLLQDGTKLEADLVTGPASSTDNAIVIFDGTTGKLVQNSACTISDTGAMTLGPIANIQHIINGGDTPVKLVPSVGSVAGINLNDYSIIEAGSGVAARFRVMDSTRTTNYFDVSASGAVTLGHASSTTGRHEIQNNVNSNQTLRVTNAGNSTPNGIYIFYSATAPNSTSSDFLYCGDTSTGRAIIRSNGGLANYSANNVNLSDIRTKEGIVPAGSYYEKIKSLEVVRFHYKDQNSKTDEDLNLGVVAQQVLEIMPEIVDEGGFNSRDETKLLAIYDTDLMFASIKALQEAMTKIESLQARIEALESGN